MYSENHYSQIQELRTNGDIKSEHVKHVMTEIDTNGYYKFELRDTARVLEVTKHVVQDGSQVLFLNMSCPRYTVLCTAVMVGGTGRVMVVHKDETDFNRLSDCMPDFLVGRIENVFVEQLEAGHRVRTNYDFIMGCLTLPVPDHIMDRLTPNGIMMVRREMSYTIEIPGKHPRYVNKTLSCSAEESSYTKFFCPYFNIKPEVLEILRLSHERKKQSKRKVKAEKPSIPISHSTAPATPASWTTAYDTTSTPAPWTTASDTPSTPTSWTPSSVSQRSSFPVPTAPTASDILTPAPQCQVCNKHLTPPTGTCLNGHVVCSTCRRFIARCPTCNTDRINASNLMLDNMLQSMGF